MSVFKSHSERNYTTNTTDPARPTPTVRYVAVQYAGAAAVLRIKLNVLVAAARIIKTNHQLLLNKHRNKYH